MSNRLQKRTHSRIYLDHASTTLPSKSVLEVVKRVSAETYGNPSSLHKEGVVAKNILEASRKNIAGILRAHSDEVIFTSGGTEANNLALFGAVGEVQKAHIIVSKIEHPSVLECIDEIEKRGGEVTYLPVSSDGIVSVKSVKDALRENTILVSIMYANNEMGTIQPIAEISKVIRSFRAKNPIIFHTDACQATNYLNMNVLKLGVDMMTINASKIYGPKGVGALYIKRAYQSPNSFKPFIFGGGQERGFRSGTENVAGIAGFSEALGISEKIKEKESERLTKLRDFFISEVLSTIPDTVLNGSANRRLPNNVNISFLGADAEQIVVRLDAQGIAASTGSACANISREGKVSKSILALDGDQIRAAGSVRFTLGRETKREDIARTVRELYSIIKNFS